MIDLKTIVLPAKGVVVHLPQILEICEQLGLTELKQHIENDPPPKPFKSDGCSWFPDVVGPVDLYAVCFKHDLAYWAGYPHPNYKQAAEEERERFVADATLMIDAVRAGLDPRIAETMFAGVRAGGTGSWRQPFSWGYGR